MNTQLNNGQERQSDQSVSATLDKEQFYLATYVSLRDEIIKRIGVGQGILSFAIILAGAFLGAGFQPGFSSTLFLVFPVLSLFLALAWVHNSEKRFHIAEYLRQIERETKLKGWGLRHLEIKTETPCAGLFLRLSGCGMFVTLNILMGVLAVVSGIDTAGGKILLGVDILFTIVIMGLFWANRQW